MSESHVRAFPSSATVGKEEVRVVKLDSLLGQLLNPFEHAFLKIDVQGYEKNVLLGATETLKRTDAIELELSLIKLYEGGILMKEMVDYLATLGFRLASLDSIFYDNVTGELLQADGIFIK